MEASSKVRAAAAKLAPVDAAALEIETLAERSVPGVKLSWDLERKENREAIKMRE